MRTPKMLNTTAKPIGLSFKLRIQGFVSWSALTCAGLAKCCVRWVFGSKLNSVLRCLNTTDGAERQMSCQSRRKISPRHAIGVVAVLAMVAATPAAAQKLVVGGTGVDEASALPTCARPLGTVALVEEKAKSDPRIMYCLRSFAR